MNWYQLFYLFSIADNLKTFFIVMVIIFTIICVAATISYFYHAHTDSAGGQTKSDESGQKMSRKWMWWSYPFAIIFWLCYIFIPSKKDLVMIIAGGAVGEFVMNDDNAKQLPADITRFLRGEILKATADLTDEAKSAIGIESEADKLKKLSREELEKMLLEKNEKSSN